MSQVGDSVSEYGDNLYESVEKALSGVSKF
jgi:hypothetical protein